MINANTDIQKQAIEILMDYEKDFKKELDDLHRQFNAAETLVYAAREANDKEKELFYIDRMYEIKEKAMDLQKNKYSKRNLIGYTLAKVLN